MRENPQDIGTWLDAASQVLWRCAVIGAAFLFIWAGAFLLASDVIYVQGKCFGLSPHECNIIHYCGLGLVKSCILVFFLFPYLAIRWMLRARRCFKTAPFGASPLRSSSGLSTTTRIESRPNCRSRSVR
jgi:hypothetical protein